MKDLFEKNVIEGLQDLASYDFQKTAWLASSGPVVSSFVEDVCYLFDSTGLKNVLKSKEQAFTPQIDQALRELHDATDAVNEDRPPQEILDDPLMQIVREKAAEALRLIGEKL